MSHYVYILWSRKDKKLYIGESADVDKRIRDHNEGRVASTKNRRPVELIKAEEYASRREALRRERFLKSAGGWKETRQIKDELMNLSERGAAR